MALKLVLIGLVAGLFSALFGVGGGIVIVPLLILVAGFESRAAMGRRWRRSGSRRSRARSSTRSRGTSTSPTPPSSACRRPPERVVGTGSSSACPGARCRSRSPGCSRRSRSGCSSRERDHDRASRSASASRRGCSPGFFGVGGGILFVPTLVALGLSQIEAEATSLLAILPTVAAGTWRQRHYGNVRWRTAARAGRRVDRRRRRRRPDRDGAAGGRAQAPLRPAPVRRRRADRLAVASYRPVSFRAMSEHDEIWMPLVDEPIGGIVAQIQADDPEIERLVGSPRRILAFRTFAYIRVGVKLGQLLVDNDVPPYDGTENWIELLLRDAGEPRGDRAGGARRRRGDRGRPALRRGRATRPGRGRARALPRVRPQARQLAPRATARSG